MRRRTKAVIFIIGIALLIILYYLFPLFEHFLNVNTALLTFLGVLIAIFSLWIFLPHNEEVVLKETVEDQIEDTLSPVSGLCLGREEELSNLERDLKHKNILLIRGIAGIGKTTLGLKFNDNLEKKGYQTFWAQLDYGSYESFLLKLSKYLKDRGSKYAPYLENKDITPEKRLRIAVQDLRKYCTILFLDDFQKLKDDSDFKVFLDYLKNSRLVIMSRTQPKFLSERYEGLQPLSKDSSVQLLKTLHLGESREVLKKVYEKTQGHPWSLVRFAELSRIIPVHKLLEEIPDFRDEQQTYMNEQCWQYLSKSEKEFLMRSSVFTKPLSFDALRVCSKKAKLQQLLISLAESFYIIKRRDHYHIHDIIRDFALGELKKNSKLFVKAQREAAHYYRKDLSAENLLLAYYHLKEAGEHRNAADLITRNIEYFWREGFWSDVRRVLEESLSFFNDKKTIASICFSLGTVIHNLGQWDRAIEYLEKSLEISEELGDTQDIARIYNNLGSIYHKKGQWERAIEYLEKSLEISEDLGDTQDIAAIYSGLGLTYHKKGQWERAIEYLEKSLEISEDLGDIQGVAITYNNLSSVYHDKGQWERAIEYFEKSLEISEELGDTQGVAITYNNLSSVYHDKSQWDRAIEYFEKDLGFSQGSRLVPSMAVTYNILGSAYHKKGQWDRAIEYFEKSLETKEELEDVYGIAITYHDMGDMFFAKKDYVHALHCYLKASKMFEKIGAKHDTKETNEKISETNKKLQEKST